MGRSEVRPNGQGSLPAGPACATNPPTGFPDLSSLHEIGGTRKPRFSTGTIVHCDLKPENIFLTGDSALPGGTRVKVLDFGIAKFLSGTTTKTTTVGLILGTPRYMSPEQCEGRDKLDAKTDVYALGVMLYEMLAGKTPFDAESSAALMRQHMCREPPPLSESAVVPKRLAELVHRMLDKEPGGRPTMAEVEAKLGDAGPGSLAPGGRARVLWAVALAVVVLLGGGAWLWARMRHDARSQAAVNSPPGSAVGSHGAGATATTATTAAAATGAGAGDASGNRAGVGTAAIPAASPPATPVSGAPSAPSRKKKRGPSEDSGKGSGEHPTTKAPPVETPAAPAGNPFAVPVAR